jgi:hypothetical protein
MCAAALFCPERAHQKLTWPLAIFAIYVTLRAHHASDKKERRLGGIQHDRASRERSVHELRSKLNGSLAATLPRVLCMTMIANLQYGWTLFVNPIAAKHGWEASAIQWAFTIFVLTETWLIPFQGFIEDLIGPRPLVLFGGIYAVPGASDRRHRGRGSLWDVCRQRAEVVSRSAWPRGRSHGCRLRHGLRDHHHRL